MLPGHTRWKIAVVAPRVINGSLTQILVADEVVSRRGTSPNGGMLMSFKRNLMGCSALLGVCFLVPAYAAAQSMSDADKIQKLERQTELLQRQSELLQKQLKEVKEELARTRKTEAKAQPAPAAEPASVAATAAASVAASVPVLVTKDRRRPQWKKLS